MTQVDFYILKEGSRGNRFSVACRLAEKAWQQGHRVYIHTCSEEESVHMDRLLWTFREQNFVPHGISSKVSPELNPVLIGDQPDPGDEHDVLINLNTEVPEFFSRFERVTECIDHDGTLRAASRERFKYYRDHGYPLKTHEL